MIESGMTLERVVNCPTLPTLPTVALEVLRLAHRPDAPLEEIADVIEHDPALAGKILKTVNSSFYGLSTPCSSIHRAMGLLGLNAVKSLVLSFTLVDTFGGRGGSSTEADGFDANASWGRAIYAACAARRLAEHQAGIDADEAFTAALLQDIGVLAMARILGESYEQLLAECREDPDALPAREREQYGFDHCRAGAELAAKWNLPQAMRETIAAHHCGEEEMAQAGLLVRIVRLSDLTARLLLDMDDNDSMEWFIARAESWLGIAAEDAATMLSEIGDAGRELARYFEVNPRVDVNPDALLAEAQEELVRHQIALDQEATALRHERETLKQRADTDDLTGLANRRCFDTYAARHFETARRDGQCLAVAFLDIDAFKPINDTHGHAAGDEILRAVAGRLREGLGEDDHLCRYGGEEFTCLMPQTDRPTAARMAEAMRQRIASEPFTVGCGSTGKTLSIDVTISVGVAVYEPDVCEHIEAVTTLVNTADRAVYAAKRAGRNCVRVANFASRQGAASTGPANASPQRSAGQRTGDRLRAADPAMSILLVEDDVLHARLITMPLERMPGVSVDHAESGEAALEAVKPQAGRTFDLILVDLNLPGMTGLELIERIRRDEALATVPIVVLSAAEEPGVVGQSLRAGANAFVPKARLGEHANDRVLQIVAFWRNTSNAA